MADTEMSGVIGAEAPVSHLHVVGGYICTGRLSQFSNESIETFDVAVDLMGGMKCEPRSKMKAYSLYSSLVPSDL